MLTPIWNSLVQLQVWFLVTEYTTFSFRLKVMSQKEKVLFAVPEDQLCRTMPDQSIGNKLMGKVCSVFAYLWRVSWSVVGGGRCTHRAIGQPEVGEPAS